MPKCKQPLTVNQARSEVPTKFTSAELVRLGIALGSFSIGEIDQGIHAVIPLKELGSNEVTRNKGFQSLYDDYFVPLLNAQCIDGMQYIEACKEWARTQGIDLD